jgi:LysR family transcriptional regulator, transcriptional activator of nhaA
VQHLNYNHLLYFWTVVREGGVHRAAEALHVTPQTVSGQLRLLEAEVGGPLFERTGRRLLPTELGRVVAGYAEGIFRQGLELARVVRGATPAGPLALSVGLAESIPKLLAYRMLQPVLQLGRPVRLVCREGALEALLADLALHRLDLVLSASGATRASNVRAFSHLLGESDLAFFGAPHLARPLQAGFPRSLDGAPWLMPSEGSAVRRVLEGWLDQHGVAPRVVGEFDDSALVKVFAQGGAGIFAAPAAVSEEICSQFDLVEFARTDEVRARFYAITAERRIKHPAIVAVTEAARGKLFEPG